MKYVVDASVVVKWYVPEIYCDESIRLLEGGNELHVPELLLPEFSNIIWKKSAATKLTRPMVGR